MEKIAIIDFGGQTCQLISRRIREMGVYTEIFAATVDLALLAQAEVKGIILSGSPFSVYEEGAPAPDPGIFSLGKPVLGICYGLQRMMYDLGGKVAPLHTKEYGRAELRFDLACPLFEAVPDGFTSWMSHGDSIEAFAPGFERVAASVHGIPAALWNRDRNLYGIQFHPEVTHCEHGNRILENFAVGICKAARTWSMDSYLVQACEKIREKAGSRQVLLLISGGVDSSVVAALLLKALPGEQVHLMYIDTGMMRKNESEEVAGMLRSLGATHLHLIDASERFLNALKGVSDPEQKRKIIGDSFVKVQAEELAKLKLDNPLLAQGTLYTDLIESGKGVGNKAHTIKSHHNVKTPLIEEKRRKGELIEPLELLYKDEVRALGLKLGLSETIVHRHPFPGPGLGVRILGEVTREKCDILRDADAVYLRELRARGLYGQIWQAFCVLLPVRSVGVAGDARKYGWVVALRAITSHDGMTADVFAFPTKDLLEISALITNQVPDVGRVVYDISSKPPATIEWE